MHKLLEESRLLTFFYFSRSTFDFSRSTLYLFSMKERIYLDNAATTSLDKDVLDAMMPYLTTHYGNPSSIYSYGRESRLAVENSRKLIAKLLNAHPSEIFFTSGGTESTSMAILAAVRDLNCKHIITSPIEHHATLHAVEYVQKTEKITVSNVSLLPNGHINLENLAHLLSSIPEKCLVALMHANNEIGNLSDIYAIGDLCKQNNAIYFADTVQTLGHYPINLRNTPVHFITGSAHKFHGPKGVGIIYINENVKIKPLIYGGAQERNMRAGTENVAGIVGFAKALEIASENYLADSTYIKSIKLYMMEQLRKHLKHVNFNGDVAGSSLYSVLSVNIPSSEKSEMLIYNLDINHICASGGSACTSGANQGSHVMQAINNNPNQDTIRFSFSKHNTYKEIDAVIKVLKDIV